MLMTIAMTMTTMMMTMTMKTMIMTMTMTVVTLLSSFPSSPDPDLLTNLDPGSSQGRPVLV